MALDIISTINLDLKRPNTETVYAVQYDTAGRIKAQLTNDGEAWHVPSSAGGMVSFRKSDNIGGFYDTTELGEVAVSVDENDDSVIYIALDAQTTITATPLDHPVQMQINFYNSQGKRLSTFAFYLRVQASVLFDGDQDERPVASEWTFRILTGALGQTIKNQEDAIKWMADNIRTQAGYVVDDTLKVPGAAGDAKKIGELFEEIVKISDSMPGYFPTTDTARVGSTKYYTRSGTAPNYVYTEFTGATFATGVTYYEYSPWNRIWIDPDDNDVVIPTMDELDEVKSALDYTAKNVIQVPTGKNLYSGMNEAVGYILTNGQLIANANFNTSDYIDVSGLESVIGSSARSNPAYPRGNLTLARLTTYDADKSILSYNNSYNSNVYTIESGVKYIRFSYEPAGTNAQDRMVESGTTYSSAFEPYTYKTVLKNSPYVENADYQQTVSSLNEVSSDVDEIESKITGNFEPSSYNYIMFTEMVDRYIKKNGQVATVSGNNYYGSDYVSVDEYGIYYVTAWANYGHALYAFYDSNNSLVAVGMLSENTSAGTEITDYEVTVPQGASKLVITYAGTGTGKIGEANSYKVKGSYPWAGKIWVCMGDSLTEVNSKTTLHYHDYIAQKTGITVNNMGKSGTGYAKTYQKSAGVTYENFMDRALTIPATCDVLTIFGSGNDNSTELPIGVYTDADHTSGTLAGYVNETIDNIYSVNPIINLGIVSPTPWQNQNPMDETCWMYRYSAMLKSICEHRSIPFLDLYHCSNLRPWDATFRQMAYSKDDGGGTHPDETGHLLIAPRFEAFLDSLLLR